MLKKESSKKDENEEDNIEINFLLKHEEEINEVYKKEKAKNIDVDINAIVLERKEAKQNQKRIEAIIKSEKEKWAMLKKRQEIKKEKANEGNYDKYIIQEPNQIRILVLGESFSGKTAFIRRFIKNEFSSEYTTTTSVESFKSELLFFQEDSYKIELIDTPPLEQFYEQLNSVLYFVQGVIFLFDPTSKNSFLRMQEYYKTTPFYNFQKTGIIATKKDICKENEKYRFHQLKKFCEENDAIPFSLSAKNGKKEIYQFINLLCPEIIPSLINRKKEIKFEYPYTKTVKNNFPKENYLDKAIIKKLQEDDSSYEGEKEITEEKNKEDIIKEYLIKKDLEKNRIIKKKINTVFNMGNNENKIIYDYKNRDFGDVMGQINLDMEKLFRKYRPDSGGKNQKSENRKKISENKKSDEEKKNIVKDEENWADKNVEELVSKFLKTDEEFNKKTSKYNEEEKQMPKEEKKEKEKEKIKNSENEKLGKEDENKDENINNKEESKEDETDRKESKEIDEDKKEEKEEEEEEKEKNEENKEEEKEEIEEEDNKSKEEDNKSKDEDNLEDENYDNLSNDIQEFQQSLLDEARRQQEY